MEKILPSKTKGRYKLRDIADAMWGLRTGPQWRNLPQCFPKFTAISVNGDRTEPLLDSIQPWTKWGENVRERQPPISTLSIDSQPIKSGPFTRWEKGVDGNKKVNGHKRHVITDTLGPVWGVVVGQPTKLTGLWPKGW